MTTKLQTCAIPPNLLFLPILGLCAGCSTTIVTSSFETPRKPSSVERTTNFRIQRVFTPKAKLRGSEQVNESVVKYQLQSLESRQNSSLVPVPYDVTVNTEDAYFQSSLDPFSIGGLHIWTLGVFPRWYGYRQVYSISMELPYATRRFAGKRCKTELTGWSLFPFSIASLFFGHDVFDESATQEKQIAQAIFASLSQSQYDSSVEAMAQMSKAKLLSGEPLSTLDKRLLEGMESDMELLIARAKHPGDLRKSLEALMSVTSEDNLEEVALGAAFQEVRVKALERITDEKRLAKVAMKTSDADIGQRSLSRIENAELICGIAQRANEDDVRCAAMRSISDQQFLVMIASSDRSPSVRQAAVSRIEDENALCSVVLRETNADVCKTILSRIHGIESFKTIAKEASDLSTRLLALERIPDRMERAQISRTNTNPRIRYRTESLYFGDTGISGEPFCAALSKVRRLHGEQVGVCFGDFTTGMDILDAAVAAMAAFPNEHVSISSPTPDGRISVLIGTDTIAEAGLSDGIVRRFSFSLSRTSVIAEERDLYDIAAKVTCKGSSMIRSDKCQTWRGAIIRSQEMFTLVVNGMRATLCSDVKESSNLARKKDELLQEIKDIKSGIGELNASSKGLIEESLLDSDSGELFLSLAVATLNGDAVKKKRERLVTLESEYRQLSFPDTMFSNPGLVLWSE